MPDDLPLVYESAEECVEEALTHIGKDIKMGLPIGVGKPTAIANAFYRAAKKDSSINLRIYSGLTLHTPTWKSELERRFVEPLAKRLFPDYIDPEYMDDVMNGRLPDNVDLREIYLSPGAGLDNDRLQQSAMSSNFTHVSRDVHAAGCNVVACMVSGKGASGLHSMGSNADAAVMMARDLIAKSRAGERVRLLAQVNPNMPYMFGAGEIAPAEFNGIVDHQQYYHQLFAPPKEPITTAEYYIGLHVGSLIRDGGTFQVGFGSLADAITLVMQMRHDRNDLYYRVISETGIYKKFNREIDTIGGTGTFKKGLYGCSEFIFDGFVHLMGSDIIKRKVYGHEGLQRTLIKHRLDGAPMGEILDALVEEGVVERHLTPRDAEFLAHYGILREGARVENGDLLLNGTRCSADLSNPAARATIHNMFLGRELLRGALIHAGFFIGSSRFYDTLRNMSDDERRLIQMREISFVNGIMDDGELKKWQRRDGRFVNTAMLVSALGGAASDTLENGQVISGVGGQYNFVSMGQSLPGARSILTVRAVRDKSGEPASNVVWTYGNYTIPRHLRDIYVTEYGIADVRGRTDSETVKAMLNVTDSRFQDALLRKAKACHKLPRNYRIPPQFRGNTPEALEKGLAPFRAKGLFKMFPYGTELTKEELTLARTLRGLKVKLSLKGFRPPAFNDARKILFPPEKAMPYLERMGLEGKPANAEELAMKKLVLYALAADDLI